MGRIFLTIGAEKDRSVVPKVQLPPRTVVSETTQSFKLQLPPKTEL